MALRLVEVAVPSDLAVELREVLDAQSGGVQWDEQMIDGRLVVRTVIDSARTGAIVDVIDDRFGASTGFHLLILPVEAALPRPSEEAEAPADAPGEEKPQRTPAVSREELYDDVRDMMRLTPVFVATVVLSTTVATIGLLRDNVAVVIGAMVIAPLLGPNVALALATSLGDLPLIKRALHSNAVGVGLSLAIAAGVGLLVDFDPTTAELATRTAVHPSDIILGLAAGAVGALAITSGVPSALVGVMVAVALLPPTVVLGLMLGAGHWDLAGRAGILVGTNVICVNLAGVVTFRIEGVRPRAWWEAARARRSAGIAVAIWLALLGVLVALILLASRTPSG